MIAFEDVTKSYPARMGRKIVLDDISHRFEPGFNTALIGSNGAGKSTMMRILSGAELPDSGTVTRHGTVSWPLGFAGGLHPSMSGRENVAFISRIYGQDFAEMLDFVEDFADIGPNMQNQTRTYSSGMKARVSFGISMAIKFSFYLIDEVIAVGDASFKRKCKRVLNERLKDSTVILISHSNSLMRDFCDYGVVLSDGKLTNQGKLEDAIAAHEDAQS